MPDQVRHDGGKVVHPSQRRSALLAKRRIGHRLQPILRNPLAAFDTGAEGAAGDTVEGCVDGAQLVLTHLPQLVQHLVIAAFGCAIVIVGIARLFEVRLDLMQAAVKLALTIPQDFLVTVDIHDLSSSPSSRWSHFRTENRILLFLEMPGGL